MNNSCKYYCKIYKNVCAGSNPNKKKVLASLPNGRNGATYKMQNVSGNSGNFLKIFSGKIDE